MCRQKVSRMCKMVLWGLKWSWWDLKGSWAHKNFEASKGPHRPKLYLHKPRKDRERTQRHFWDIWNGPGSHKEISGRSDRALGATEIGEFKKWSMGSSLDLKEFETETILINLWRGPKGPERFWEWLNGPGLGAHKNRGKLKDEAKWYKSRKRCPRTPLENTPIPIFEICSITSTLAVRSASLLRKWKNFDEEFSFRPMGPSWIFKEPIFLLIIQGKCYTPIATHLYPPLGETDIRGGTLLEHQCLCSERDAANPSFSIWYIYYLSLMTEQCCSDVSIAADNGLHITLPSHTLGVCCCWWAMRRRREFLVSHWWWNQ